MAEHDKRERPLVDASDPNGRRGFLRTAAGAVGSPVLFGAMATPARAQATRSDSAPPAPAEPRDGQSVVVRTTHGSLRGIRNGGLTIFKGVPYAGSPGGAGRFQAPPKLAPWTGVRDALVYGPAGDSATRRRLAEGVGEGRVE